MSVLNLQIQRAIVRTVSITVNDGTDPIEGASVVIDETTKTTGSAGGCSFSLTDGTYSASVTKEGYEDKTASITVASGSTSATISLTAVTVEETTPGGG